MPTLKPIPQWEPGNYEANALIQFDGIVYARTTYLYVPRSGKTPGHNPHVWEPLGAVAHIEAMAKALTTLEQIYEALPDEAPYHGLTVIVERRSQELRAALAPFLDG